MSHADQIKPFNVNRDFKKTFIITNLPVNIQLANVTCIVYSLDKLTKILNPHFREISTYTIKRSIYTVYILNDIFLPITEVLDEKIV